MFTAMGSAFRKMIESKMGGKAELNKALFVDEDDRLRARLAAWQRAVDEARGYRGGEAGEIWHIEAEREAEKAAKAEAKRLKELAKAENELKISFTIKELYKRVLRVERLTEICESQGLEVRKMLSEAGLNHIVKRKSAANNADLVSQSSRGGSRSKRSRRLTVGLR